MPRLSGQWPVELIGLSTVRASVHDSMRYRSWPLIRGRFAWSMTELRPTQRRAARKRSLFLKLCKELTLSALLKEILGSLGVEYRHWAWNSLNAWISYYWNVPTSKENWLYLPVPLLKDEAKVMMLFVVDPSLIVDESFWVWSGRAIRPALLDDEEEVSDEQPMFWTLLRRCAIVL